MHLRKVYTIARHEYTVTVRRPGFIVLTATVPVLGLVVAVLVLVAGRGLLAQVDTLVGAMEKPIGVVDKSGYFSPVLPAFADDFQRYEDETEVYRAVDEGRLQAAIVIPPDYVQTGRVYVYSPQNVFQRVSLEDSHRLRAFLAVHLSRPWVPEEVLVRLSEPLVTLTPVASRQETAGPWASFTQVLVPYMVAILLVISVFASSGYLIQGLAEEKENRLVEIIISSVTPMEWFVGKVVGLGAAGLTQMGIWMLTSLALSGGAMLALVAVSPIPWYRWGLFLLYYALGYALYAVLQAGLGALGTSTRETQQIAGLASVVAFVPFMLSGLVFTVPDAPLVRGLSYFPLTAPTMMIFRLAVFSVPTVDVVVSLTLLVVSIPVAGWIGAKLFRLGILFYGKRPSLAEIWYALRSA